MAAGGDEACSAGGGEFAGDAARGDADFALSPMVTTVTRVVERSAVTGILTGWLALAGEFGFSAGFHGQKSGKKRRGKRGAELLVRGICEVAATIQKGNVR